MRVERSSLVWSVAFGLLFAGSLALRSAGAPRAVNLVLAGLLFGTYCAFFALPSLTKRVKRPPLLLQVIVGAALGGVLVLLFGAASDLVIPGVIVGGALGYFADLWAHHVELP